MNKENLKLLIASIKEGDFNWFNKATCIESHCRKLSGIEYSERNITAMFLDIPLEDAKNLYIGQDFEGNDLIVWEGQFGRKNYKKHKEVAVEYLTSLLD